MHFFILYAILYTNSKQSERKLKKKNHLQITKRKEYLGVNLTIKAKGTYTENYKILNKLKKTQLNGKTSCADGLGDLILLRYL